MQQVAEADLIITSGGVSVGEEDYVRIALQELGTLDMWRIKIKPGKPLAFGRIGTTPFLGMPGNPVSVFATFCIMARPFILRMQGNANTTVPTYPVAADFDWSGDSRLEYIRVRLVHEDNDQPHLQLFSNQSSGVLTSTSWATGFAIAEPHVNIKQGDHIPYLPFNSVFAS